MKLTLQNVYGSTIVLATIISGQRSMPQKGKYRVARLHAKLLPEFNLINDRREELIKSYKNPQMRVVPGTVAAEGEAPQMEIVPGEWQVPPDKMPEYTAAWKVIGDEEIDVDVQPMPLSTLCLPDDIDGAIEAHELVTLGDLVFED